MAGLIFRYTCVEAVGGALGELSDREWVASPDALWLTDKLLSLDSEQGFALQAILEAKHHKSAAIKSSPLRV